MTNAQPTRGVRLLVTLAALALTAAGCGPEPPPARTWAASILAVGDTGKAPEPIPLTDPLLAVSSAMAREDERAPVDAVVLLGDNFYPDGLRESNMKDRLRENIVGPFCHFVRLSARGRGSLGDSCDAPESQRHPVPLYAVLGNHDYNERESPMLQRKRVPLYVENWKTPEDHIRVEELAGGVSLILVDSMRWVRNEGGLELADTIERSRGPWRIVAAHHPMVDTGDAWDERYAGRMRALLDAAGVPVHVFLAGHEHNMQALELPGAWPRLHVVAGSGADLREVGGPRAGRLYAADAYGFVRLDVEPGREGRMLVRFFEVSPVRTGPRASGRMAAQLVLTRDGTLTEMR